MTTPMRRPTPILILAAAALAAATPAPGAQPPANSHATSPSAAAVALPATEPATTPATAPAVALPATGPTTAAVAAITPATSPATAPTTTASSATSPTTAATRTLAGSARPTSAAATPPQVRFVPKPMSSDYALLNSRSIFVKGRPRVIGSREDGAPDTQRADGPKQEAVVVLNGITEADDEVVAFMENTSTGEIFRARVGEPVAKGRVVQITLDGLEYEADGGVFRVEIGQSLALARREATSRPAGAAGGPATNPTEMDEVLERLRRKRAAELE